MNYHTKKSLLSAPSLARSMFMGFVIWIVSTTFCVASEFVFSKQEVQVLGLTPKELSLVQSLSQQQLDQAVIVNLQDEQNKTLGNVWGAVRADSHSLHFVPRFPFDEGQQYQVTFNLNSENLSEHYNKIFSFNAAPREPSTIVTQVYPTANTLPENLFKFYIHFSEPMSRGEAYQHISLLNENKQKVELPFLEITQELWDSSGQRFTLLFDPGRTKKGIKPNRDMGLPLKAGKSFTLVIDENWLDANGTPLKQRFRKAFTVSQQDQTQPAIKNWIVHTPKAGTSDPVTVQFDEPLDNAQLETAVWIETEDGKLVEGQLSIENELHWSFAPNKAWNQGGYKIVAKSYLEDQAANSLGRAFEVIRAQEDPSIPEFYSLPFSIIK